MKTIECEVLKPIKKQGRQKDKQGRVTGVLGQDAFYNPRVTGEKGQVIKYGETMMVPESEVEELTDLGYVIPITAKQTNPKPKNGNKAKSIDDVEK